MIRRGVLAVGVLALLCIVVGLLEHHHDGATVLSERLALELAEGKESKVEQEGIRLGGTRDELSHLGTQLKRARHQVHVSKSEERKAMDALAAWRKQEEAKEVEESMRVRSSKGVAVSKTQLRQFLDVNGGAATQLVGQSGDSHVRVASIERADAQVGDEMSDRKEDAFLQAAARKFSHAKRPAVPHKPSREVRAFLQSNGDAQLATKLVKARHVGVVDIVGGDRHVDVDQLRRMDREHEVGVHVPLSQLSRSQEVQAHGLKDKLLRGLGVAVDSEPWQSANGKLF